MYWERENVQDAATTVFIPTKLCHTFWWNRMGWRAHAANSRFPWAQFLLEPRQTPLQKDLLQGNKKNYLNLIQKIISLVKYGYGRSKVFFITIYYLLDLISWKLWAVLRIRRILIRIRIPGSVPLTNGSWLGSRSGSTTLVMGTGCLQHLRWNSSLLYSVSSFISQFFKLPPPNSCNKNAILRMFCFRFFTGLLLN